MITHVDCSYDFGEGSDVGSGLTLGISPPRTHLVVLWCNVHLNILPQVLGIQIANDNEIHLEKTAQLHDLSPQ